MRVHLVAQAASAIWPGLLGGLAATGVALLLRTEAGIPLFPEIVLDAATHRLHPYLFETLLQTFGRWAKALLFLSVTLGEVGLYAACWVATHRGGTHDLRRAVLAAAVVTAVLLVVSAILWLATAADPPSSATVAWYTAGTMSTSIVFATVAYLASQETASLSFDARRTRRQILGGSVAVAAGALGFVSIGRMVRQSVEAGARRIAGRPTPEVTPTNDFYVVSKNLIDPDVDVRG